MISYEESFAEDLQLYTSDKVKTSSIHNANVNSARALDRIACWTNHHHLNDYPFDTYRSGYKPEHALRALEHFSAYPEGKAITAYLQKHESDPGEEPFYIFFAESLKRSPETYVDRLLIFNALLTGVENYLEVAKTSDFPGLDQIRQERSRSLLEVLVYRQTSKYNYNQDAIGTFFDVLSTPSEARGEEIDMTKEVLEKLNSLAAKAPDSDTLLEITGRDFSVKKTDLLDALQYLLDSRTSYIEYWKSRNSPPKPRSPDNQDINSALVQLQGVGEVFATTFGVAKEDLPWQSKIDQTLHMSNGREDLRQTPRPSPKPPSKLIRPDSRPAPLDFYQTRGHDQGEDR